MSRQFWGKKSFIFITGASQGIGRGIAIEFSKKVAPESLLVLAARNAEKLEETKALIAEDSPLVKVHISVMDFSELNTEEEYEQMFQNAISSAGEEESRDSFEHAMIVHNAASLGDVNKRICQHSDPNFLQRYYNLNLLSPILLNSVFLKLFPDSSKLRTVIQISSIAGKMPVPSMGTYGVGKAARNMLMRVVAGEEENVTALSYAPGLVETDMYVACENSEDPKLSGLFRGMREIGNLGSGEQMYQHLVQLLESGEFENGAFVDFYAKPEEYHPGFEGIQL